MKIILKIHFFDWACMGFYPIPIVTCNFYLNANFIFISIGQKFKILNNHHRSEILAFLRDHTSVTNKSEIWKIENLENPRNWFLTYTERNGCNKKEKKEWKKEKIHFDLNNFPKR